MSSGADDPAKSPPTSSPATGELGSASTVAAASQSDATIGTHTPSGGGGRASRPSIKAEGVRLGRYTIRKLLGRGGMGAVYEADDVELERRVALKVLREDREHPTEGLRREAQALARLVHQNVVMVYDVGIDSGEVFLVMQLVEGLTVDAWIAKHRPSTAAILELIEQAGRGLAAAHDAGLVHCDFKPANVLVDAKGVARVGDFGLARATRSVAIAAVASLTPLVGMTTVAGTPAYMAPEQFAGVITAASDQFAFCVALWECLAGERPYADSAVPVLELAARGERRPLPHAARIPRHVVRALERGLSSDPSDRFSSMAALVAALQPPRRIVLIASIAASVGLLAGGVAAYAVFGRATEHRWDGADVARSKRLTAYGTDACAYAVSVEPGGEQVVFDRTEGDAVDLYTVPLAGDGALTPPRQLTSAAGTWEWRSQQGRRPGEVIHLVHDPADPAKSYVAYLDIATGTSTRVLDGMSWDATVVGATDTVYYSPSRAGGIRVLRGGVDRPFASPAPEEKFFLVAASPRGDRVALSKSLANGGGSQPCVVDATTTKLECLDYEVLSRPVFSPDGSALYFGTYDGIVRHELATGRSAFVVKGAYSESVAVAPRGDALVYSTCYAHTQLRNLTRDEMPIAGERVMFATESATGLLAWVEDRRGTHVLLVRTTDGRELQLTTAAQGNVSAPSSVPTVAGSCSRPGEGRTGCASRASMTSA